MTLNKLGGEYLNGSQMIKDRIVWLRLSLKALSYDERRHMRVRIKNLYSMATDSKITGHYLQNYYERGNVKWKS